MTSFPGSDILRSIRTNYQNQMIALPASNKTIIVLVALLAISIFVASYLAGTFFSLKFRKAKGENISQLPEDQKENKLEDANKQSIENSTSQKLNNKVEILTKNLITEPKHDESDEKNSGDLAKSDLLTPPKIGIDSIDTPVITKNPISPFYPYDTKGYQFTLDSPDGVEGYFIGRIDLNDLNKLDSEGFPPLATALGEYRGKNPEAIERIGKLALYILEKTQNPNPDYSSKIMLKTLPIFNAIKLNLIEVVQKMVELGIKKDIKSIFLGKPNGGNPLEEARKTGHAEIIQILDAYYK